VSRNAGDTTRHDNDEGEGLTYHHCGGEHTLHHNRKGEKCLASPRGETRRRHAEEKCGATTTNVTSFGCMEKKEEYLA